MFSFFKIVHRELSAKHILVGEKYVAKVAGLNPHPGKVRGYCLIPDLPITSTDS